MRKLIRLPLQRVRRGRLLGWNAGISVAISGADSRGDLQPPSPPPSAKLGAAPVGAADRVGSTRRAFGLFGPLKYPAIASMQSGFNPAPPVSRCAFSAFRRRGSHEAWMCFAMPSSASCFG